jgi:hypothetical protein
MYPIVVSIGTASIGSLTEALSFDAPTLRSGFVLSNTPAAGGEDVTLQGSFSFVDLSPTMRVGDTTSLETLWLTPTSIACKVMPLPNLITFHERLKFEAVLLGRSWLCVTAHGKRCDDRQIDRDDYRVRVLRRSCGIFVHR